ncbi:MAG TPA: alpha/beta hydrolase fold domain-containing protein, partial [Solirubrobacteraceae bacterium]|nr:alpha/beta hydrolase fold domain-containing protein [Solirubrobacteraceae bacterium]
MLDQASAGLLKQLATSGLRPLHELAAADARAAGTRMAELYGQGPDMARVRDLTLPAGDGASVTARVLVPHQTPRAVIVYYHGGGWVLGSLDQYDTLARELAHRAGAAVVLVDYRLAPEHRFPTAVDDAWSALRWAAANAEAIAGREVP